jgi:hypothetical protein
MSVTAKALFDAHTAQATDNVEYTAPTATHTIIDKFTATNITGSSQTLTINLIPSGGSVATANIITNALSIAAGATVDVTDVKNHILNPGDAISAKCGNASALVIRSSGREVT